MTRPLFTITGREYFAVGHIRHHHWRAYWILRQHPSGSVGAIDASWSQQDSGKPAPTPAPLSAPTAQEE